MNNKTSRRAKLIDKDTKYAMKHDGGTYQTAHRKVLETNGFRVTDGGTNHNGGAGNTRWSYKGN